MKVSEDVRRDIQLAQDTLNEALHSPDIDRALVYVSAVAELMDLLSKSICKFCGGKQGAHTELHAHTVSIDGQAVG